MKQVGASLNLHNAAIVFCHLCVLFTIYVSGTNYEISQLSEMNKKGKVDWLQIDGSSPKQNGFTWKKRKQIACITVQYRYVIMMDLKVNAAAGNM